MNIDKKFEIIYSDPPWDYGKKMQSGSGASAQYPTMKTKDMITEFAPKMEEWADDNCLLFMWTSSPHLDQAIKLGEGWGFKYSTVGFVWHKGAPVVGSYTMSECELCLIFKKGKIPSPRGARNIRQFLMEPKKQHSRKPLEIKERIGEMFPTQHKLEMFARATTKNWESFGNQIEKFNDNELTLNFDENE